MLRSLKSVVFPLAATSLVALSGCNQIFYVEAEASALCQAWPSQRFAISDALRAQLAELPPAMMPQMEIAQGYEFDVNVQLPPELEKAHTSIKLNSVTMSTSDQSKHFGMIDSAKITLEPPAGSTVPRRSVEYVRSADEPKEIVLGGEDFELLPYITNGTIKYNMAVVGTFRDMEVNADIEACATASVRLNYLE